MIRSVKEAKDKFPFTMSTLCYFELTNDGKLNRVYHKNKSDRPSLTEAYCNAKNGKSLLYVVWPGQWSSDLFIVDDLKEFAKHFEINE